MHAWLRPAVDYIADWLELQLTGSQQPGVIIAISHRGDIIAEHAFGLADIDTGEKLSPRHRFRLSPGRSRGPSRETSRRCADCRAG